MSTNFYQRPLGAKTFDEEKNHIGLSTADLFLFEAHVRRKLTTYKQWIAQLMKAGFEIVDEYNRTYTVAEFEEFVKIRKNAEEIAAYRNSPVVPAGNSLKDVRRYRDEDGHLFCNYQFS